MPANPQTARVFHAQLYGLRQAKYDWLDAHTHADTSWAELKPHSPFYLFVPREGQHAEQYQQFALVSTIFPVNITGIVTARDALCIDFNDAALIAKIRPLQDKNQSDEYLRQYLAVLLGREPSKVENYAWRVSEARQSLSQVQKLDEPIVSILYRPFDSRRIFFHPSIVWRTRENIMRHMLAGENRALCVGRQGQVVGVNEWNLVFCSNSVQDFNLFYRGGNITFPLYLYPYPSSERTDLFTQHGTSERVPNLSPSLLAGLGAAYGEPPTPEQVFHYVYAVLYAPSYRAKYAEFLRMDFPRVPFAADRALFLGMAELGERLAELHLLTSPELDPPSCRFEGQGDSVVARNRGAGLRYEPDEERVYINPTQYFGPVPPEVYGYQVGGYTVCEKWLKDRKERRLGLDDIRTYCKVVTALGRTLELQAAIDEIYPQVETATITGEKAP